MADPITLPRVKSSQPIADKDGRAASAFVMFWEKLCRQVEGLFRSIIAVNTRQDEADEAISDLVLTIAGVLNGTIPFSQLNVADTQYRAFLEKTDGTKLVNPTGLGTSVVTTPSVQSQAITNYASSYTGATLTLTGTTSKIVQTLTYTSTGTRLNVRINFYLTVWHPAAGGIEAIVTITRTGVSNIFNQTFEAVDGDLLQGWQTIEIEDNPGPGTWTYDALVTLTNNGAATQTVQSRFMGVTELKR